MTDSTLLDDLTSEQRHLIDQLDDFFIELVNSAPRELIAMWEPEDIRGKLARVPEYSVVDAVEAAIEGRLVMET